MEILFIGGTGNISSACTEAAIGRGYTVTHLNRGNNKAVVPNGVKTIVADAKNSESVKDAVSGKTFDAVVDWIAFDVDDVERDIEIFKPLCSQFIFISSASAYRKPPSHYLITESTAVSNPFWEYSRKKIACELRLMEEYRASGFPITIVRPSHTYGTGWIPTSFGSRDYTIPARIEAGKPIVVHGDGSSLWTLTHTEDFAKGFTGIIGNGLAIGETFHITSDEALSWDRIHMEIGAALGIEPHIVHVPSEVIARHSDRFGPGLLGDKTHTSVFDNTKIKRFVPGFEATIPFFEGVRRSVKWMEEDTSRQVIDTETDNLIDELVGLYSS